MMKFNLRAMPVLMIGIVCSFFISCSGNKESGDYDSDTLSLQDSAAGLSDSAAGDSATLDSLLSPLTKVEESDSLTRYETLSDADLQFVAGQLGIEVAAMKAVVVIEAGAEMKGFWAPGIPIVNFDPTVYRQVASTAPSTAGNPAARVPEGLTGYGLKEWTQLTKARVVNAQGADMGTFWGMFQIGGFNYDKCDCKSVGEFVEKMSNSELSQLLLFARFIVNTDMVKYLRAKDWAKFSRAYNGPQYAQRKYDVKMAEAYRKFSASN